MARGEYRTYVGDDEHEHEHDHDRDREWWRRAPSGWRGTRDQWRLLPEWQQRQWWQYYQQQSYQQPYYQQPYYQQPYQQYPGWRWVPGYGGTAGHWERARAW